MTPPRPTSQPPPLPKADSARPKRFTWKHGLRYLGYYALGAVGLAYMDYRKDGHLDPIQIVSLVGALVVVAIITGLTGWLINKAD